MNTENLNLLIATLIPILGAVLAALATVGITILKRKAGLQETQVDLQREANLRDKLQASLVTAVGLYRQGKPDQAVAYVIERAGDAAKQFGYGEGTLAEIIANKAVAWAGPAPAQDASR